MELDYDLEGCLQYNPQEGITPETIAAVVAVWEGENDGDDWRWVLAMNDGRFAFVQGGCDYTGWDCQSWATSVFAATVDDAAKYALGDDTPAGTLLEPQGLGHMISMMNGDYMSNANEVYESLARQIAEGKDTTWRESKDAEFGVTSGR